MVAEIKSATQQAGVGSKRNRYEYDSDEEVEGGTWEHKTRTKEMKQTEGTCVEFVRVCVCMCACVCARMCTNVHVYRILTTPLDTLYTYMYIVYIHTVFSTVW